MGTGEVWKQRRRLGVPDQALCRLQKGRVLLTLFLTFLQPLPLPFFPLLTARLQTMQPCASNITVASCTGCCHFSLC